MKKNPEEPKAIKPKTKSSVVTRRYQFTGPIPHPNLLNQYDPQTRKTIVEMADRQSKHRQSIEASVIHSNIRNEQAGMYIAALLTLTMIGGGIYLLMNDKEAIGFLMIFATSVFQAGNYVYNKKKEEEIQKEEK